MKVPDPQLTPGAVSPRGHEARSVRKATKNAVYDSYRVPVARRAFYRIDHLVPLSLGGDNSTDNLWAQPRRESRRKDRCEELLLRWVRDGVITVAAAQAIIRNPRSW